MMISEEESFGSKDQLGLEEELLLVVDVAHEASIEAGGLHSLQRGPRDKVITNNREIIRYIRNF
ncbi:MAG: hypothetical protein LDLANPLL_02178 [Turneriella sp.]|nr:hypothetical protein [Turneriella sp.]